MTQPTEQERLNEFQQHLRKDLSREINSKHYHPSTITIPGSANTLSKEATPYFEEEQKYHRMKSALANLESVDETELFQIRQNLENLIERYAPMVQLNELCREYYKKILEVVIPIGNSYIRENFDNGLKALTKLSKRKITRNNLKNLINYIEKVEENYLHRVKTSALSEKGFSRDPGWRATWSSEPRPVWNKL